MKQSASPAVTRKMGSIGTTISAIRHKQPGCRIKNDCSCFAIGNGIVSRRQSDKVNPVSKKVPKRILHMDDCNDPECLDRKQMEELQQSLDHFTDYDHYERCCDEGGRHHHHCSHGAVVEDGECCDATMLDAWSGLTTAKTSIDCSNCFDNCDECVKEHVDCYEEVDVCEDDCEQCEEECEERGHEREDCPQNHPTTRDNCLESCSVPLPLLGPTDDFDLHTFSNIVPELTPCTDDCGIPWQPLHQAPSHVQEQAFDTAMDHWHTFVQAHHCAPDPCLVGHIPQFTPPQHVDPAFGFGFDCDPMDPANRYPWQIQQPQCAIPTPSSASSIPMSLISSPQRSHPGLSPSASSKSSTASTSTISSDQARAAATDRTCQWVMPCGSICGSNFTRTEDLKKHVKNSHGVKGTVTCGWKDCTASFATEAALTGHISKKHLAFDEEGPWKCTFPNCSKTFMYKQVRDEHVASHNGGNKMHCPICHQWLNAEGSNFRRHMASHNPKHEHMKCKYEYLGCKKRFPRVDNLRRHETCCKFGKRAQGVHHHHHKVHVH